MQSHIATKFVGWFVLGMVLTTLVSSSGCSRAPDDRVPVGGTVLIDGEPLSHGAIVFVPKEGTIGPRASAEIRDGKYELDASDGPAVGTFRVQVWGRDESGVPDVKHTTSAGITSVPPQYNAQSTLEVQTQAGENRFDFDFKSSQSTAAYRTSYAYKE